MTTTVPNPATELGYLAEALTDHNRRHDTPAGAALELATVLASVLTPADLNRITDALDTVGLLTAAGAELAAAIAGERVAGVHVAAERGPRADLVIVNDPPDAELAAATIAAGRYRVTFDAGLRGEARIGRTYNVPPLELAVADDDAEAIGDAVYRIARPLLRSGDIDVHVNPGPTPNTGRVIIIAGYQNAGTGTYYRVGDQ